METNINKQRIMCAFGDAIGCGQYRIINPYSYLHKKYDIDTCITIVFREEDILNYDLIILQRQYDSGILNTYLKAKQKKPSLKIIYELDDYFHEIPKWSPCYSYYPKDSMRLDNIIKFISVADAVTVSTEMLKRAYAQHNKNIHVLPNYIYDHDMPKNIEKIKRDDENDIIILWAGSCTHFEDLRSISTVLTKLFEEDNRLKLYLMGHDYSYLFSGISVSRKKFIRGTLPEKREYEKTIQKILDDSGSDINFMDLLTKDNKYNTVAQYYEIMAKLDVDIAVAPLVDNAFNRAKSDIKLKEYTAFNIPYVASAVTPYIEYNQHIDFHKASKSSCGLLAANDKEWKRCLKHMIDNRSSFKERQAERYGEITLENNIERYKNMLEKVMNT